MDTLGQIFKFNCKRLRGDRRQEDIASALGVPTSAYQRTESGKIPRSDKRIKELARVLGAKCVGELFLDPGLISVKDCVPDDIAEALSRLDEADRAVVRGVLTGLLDAASRRQRK